VFAQVHKPTVTKKKVVVSFVLRSLECAASAEAAEATACLNGVDELVAQ
jgi:hypothetical protein